MDVHRCRFVPYQPWAINALAFSQPWRSSPSHLSIIKLAVGRANGDIEIWNPRKGIWHQELVLRGGKDRSIDGLVWVTLPDQILADGRLALGRTRIFSIGYTSAVTEWDLEKGKPKRHASGQHGDIWCLAAQPDEPQTSAAAETQISHKLLAGTVDGELALYSVEDDELVFQRLLVRSPTKKSQMVSITFQSRNIAIVGCSDSTIRAYNVANGHLLRRMTLGSDLVSGTKNIIIWSVKCLPNGNIVSGDSAGQVCIWDGKKYTQYQRMQSHKQDVLSLAVSADGESIVSGGMDRRTSLHKLSPGAHSGDRWCRVWGKRYHRHDVKAMASFELDGFSVVVSGGPDADLVVLPLREMGRENHRTISCLPQQAPMASAPNARFMVSWWDRQVHVWLLTKPTTELFASNGNHLDQHRKLLKSIVIKGDANITSATVDRDGTFLVVSTAIDVKAFRLSHHNPSGPSDVAIVAVELTERLTCLGASRVLLSPNGKWLCVTREGTRILVADVQAERRGREASGTRVKPQRLSRLDRDIARHITIGGLGKYDRTIVQVAFNADSEMLAVADLAGFIDTWILRNQDDATTKMSKEGDGDDDDDDDDDGGLLSSDSSSSSHSEDEGSDGMERWIRNPMAQQMPKLPSTPVVLTFSDHLPVSGARAGGFKEAVDDYMLVAITSSWHVLAFHPRRGALTSWSRRHPRDKLPAAMLDLLDLPKGVLWQGSRMWIYGVSFLVMIDTDRDVSPLVMDAGGPVDSQKAQGTKRKRTTATSGAGGIIQKENLVPHKVWKHREDGNYEEFDVDKCVRRNVGDGDEEELPDAGGESFLRHTGKTESDEGGQAVGAGAEQTRFWMTLKYRPILGVVPLNAADKPLEVALVEVPVWDRDLPDRYLTAEERD